MSVQDEIQTLGHEHVYLGDSHDQNARRTLWVVCLTAVMMVGEIIAGTVFNSMALLADGFHMATHAGALAIAAAAYAFAKRNATNRRFSFGTGKVGDLAGFTSAVILGLVALGIAGESVGRLIEPRQVAFSQATVVAVMGLFVNVVSALILSGGHDRQHHKSNRHDDGHVDAARHHDHNLRAAFVHVLADALTSVLAIVALLAGTYLGWTSLDPLIGIVGAIVIAAWSWTLMRDTAAVLLDAADKGLEAEVRQHVEAEGDARIVDLHVWRIGPGAQAAIISVAGQADGAAVRSRLVTLRQLAHVTVEKR